MADFTAIAAAGQSLERLLSAAFADPSNVAPVPGEVTRAMLVQGESLTTGSLPRPCLALLLHRVSVDRAARNALPIPGTAPGATAGTSYIPLVLHYLVMPFAADAVGEQRILGRALQALEQSPVISGPSLVPAGVWAATDALQLTLEELPPDERLQLFASLLLPVRASLSYVLRVPSFDVSRNAASPARPVLGIPRR